MPGAGDVQRRSGNASTVVLVNGAMPGSAWTGRREDGTGRFPPVDTRQKAFRPERYGQAEADAASDRSRFAT